MNVPPIIGTLISRGKATLYELQTVYGVHDAYQMLEVIAVDDYNQYIARKE